MYITEWGDDDWLIVNNGADILCPACVAKGRVDILADAGKNPVSSDRSFAAIAILGSWDGCEVCADCGRSPEGDLPKNEKEA